MRLVALAIFAAVSSPALGQQPIPTCIESVTSYRTNVAQQFKVDTLLQVKAEEAATYFVISDVLTLAEDNRGVLCPSNAWNRLGLSATGSPRPSGHAAERACR